MSKKKNEPDLQVVTAHFRRGRAGAGRSEVRPRVPPANVGAAGYPPRISYCAPFPGYFVALGLLFVASIGSQKCQNGLTTSTPDVYLGGKTSDSYGIRRCCACDVLRFNTFDKSLQMARCARPLG